MRSKAADQGSLTALQSGNFQDPGNRSGGQSGDVWSRNTTEKNVWTANVRLVLRSPELNKKFSFRR